MEWSFFWTVLAQVGIAVVAFSILSLFLRYALSNLTYGVARALPRRQEYQQVFYGGSANDDE